MQVTVLKWTHSYYIVPRSPIEGQYFPRGQVIERLSLVRTREDEIRDATTQPPLIVIRVCGVAHVKHEAEKLELFRSFLNPGNAGAK